jgi:hypothetical protein
VREGYSAVLAAVKSGRISEARVDASLLRIAAAKSLLAAPLEFSTERLLELSTRIAALNQNLN